MVTTSSAANDFKVVSVTTLPYVYDLLTTSTEIMAIATCQIFKFSIQINIPDRIIGEDLSLGELSFGCLSPLFFDINEWFVEWKQIQILSVEFQCFLLKRSVEINLWYWYMGTDIGIRIFNWRLIFPFLRGFLPHQPWWQLFQVERCNNQVRPTHHSGAEPLQHTGVFHLPKSRLLLLQMASLYPVHYGSLPYSQNV